MNWQTDLSRLCSELTVVPSQLCAHKPCLLICSEKQASPITNYPEMSAANGVTFMVPSGKRFLCIWPETFYRRHSSQIFYMVRSWKHWGESLFRPPTRPSGNWSMILHYGGGFDTTDCNFSLFTIVRRDCLLHEETNQVYLQKFCSACMRRSRFHSSYCVHFSWLHVRQWHRETWHHGIPQQTSWPKV